MAGELEARVRAIPWWGWAAAAGVAFYLWRQQSQQAASAGTDTSTPAASPMWAISPDMLGAGAGTASSVPDQAATSPSSPGPTGAPTGIEQQAATLLAGYQHPAQLPGGQTFPQWVNQQPADVQSFFHQIGASQQFQQNPRAVEQFFAMNQSLRAQHLPYYSGQTIVNPITGQTIAQTSTGGTSAWWLSTGQTLPAGFLTPGQLAVVRANNLHA